ncbi:unnamed protein product [marine sediment metagenome]|uniref:TNase-like domain-containing protein n=1 Tax=marine sediment metagenome TaxID=412755 RepID=X1D4R9_9ZZZZ
MPRGKVKRVIDGDTFELRSGERVHIAGLNAAELDERGGQQAKRHLQSKIPRGTEVGLSKPLAKSYGRIVRFIDVLP